MAFGGSSDLEGKFAGVKEAMGNKNTIPPKCPDAASTREEEGMSADGVAGKAFHFIYDLVFVGLAFFVPACLVAVELLQQVSVDVDGERLRPIR